MDDFLAEVDLEIAIRHRLADTVQSRIAWALILQDSLQKEDGKAFQDFPPNDPLATLSITESSAEFILASEPRAPPSRYIRPPRKSNLPISKTKSFLYIRSSALAIGTQGRDDIYRLQCPECLRISFSSLQGLLNHARLAHNLEWGTHDECIRACAVPGNETEVEGGVEVGLGPTGVLPGLRTIFQMAVGAQENLQGESIIIASNSQSPSMTSHLTKTLGLHEDSATLAPYLGKQALRREIRVWDEDKQVDIETLTHPDGQVDQKQKYPWKMPFKQRNSVTSESNSYMKLFGDGSQTSPQSKMSIEPQSIPGVSPRPTIPKMVSQKLPSNQSRFYFGTRIIITDRSLWIPPEQRSIQNKTHTHKWMISVDSPSYTYHITSTLDSLAVTPLIPGMSTLPITSEPPFVVVGTSDQPFLARIELTFTRSGNPKDQKVVLEHWVELDPLRTHNVVQGEDQVVDIELNKGTMLKPILSGYSPIGAKSLWDRAGDLWITPEEPVKVEPQTRPLSIPFVNYETILMDILPTFPMTQKDAKNRSSSSTLPYQLVSSPTYFKTLVTGRRKAIEWGRARAIQSAYCRIMEQMTCVEDVIPLSVGDVYSWLSENGHFPVMFEDRNEQCENKNDENHPLQLRDRALECWCRVCGLDVVAHQWERVCEEGDTVQDMNMRNPVDLSWPKSDNRCHIVPIELQTASLPIFDIRRVITRQSERLAVHSPTGLYPAKVLVAIGDPLLTVSISRIVNALCLKHLVPLEMTCNEKGRHGKTDVERNLAPFSLLAVIAKFFIRLLVERGLEVATRDKKNGARFFSKYEKKRDGGTTMLTPTHILRGVRELDNVAWCLARLGGDQNQNGG